MSGEGARQTLRDTGATAGRFGKAAGEPASAALGEPEALGRGGNCPGAWSDRPWRAVVDARPAGCTSVLARPESHDGPAEICRCAPVCQPEFRQGERVFE